MLLEYENLLLRRKLSPEKENLMSMNYNILKPGTKNKVGRIVKFLFVIGISLAN